MHFKGTLHILTFYSNRKKIERNQKHRQSKVFLVSVKNVFAQSSVLWLRKGGGNEERGSFLALAILVFYTGKHPGILSL
jgi:hypothetical protein